MRWVVAALVFFAIITRQRHVLAAVAVGWSEFEADGGAYFAPSYVAEERRALSLILAAARQRVAAFYGPLRAQPKLILADSETLTRFTSNNTGITQYLPTGAVIVLGPKGLNIDVMAHELAHAELMARRGYRATVWCVPTWFDEGLATQFDARSYYTDAAYGQRVAEGWRLPAFDELATEAGFFQGDRDHIRFHYAGARMAVAEWLRKHADEGPALIERIACGDAWQAELKAIAAGVPSAASSEH
jgi:hypothetical protein